MDDYTNIIDDLQSYLVNPSRKTYYIYLITSLLIGVIYLISFKKNTGYSTKQNFKKYLFNRLHWFGTSPTIDYYLVIVNSLVRVLLIVPFFLSGVSISYSIAKWLMVNFDSPPLYNGSALPVIIAYTFCLWIVGDFSRFFLHYLAHRLPFLWEFHKVHHSATVMNPFTLFRQHPVEMFLFHLRGSLVFGLVTGIFYYYFSYSLGLVEILGVNIGRFIFLAAGANLRHSHVPLTYGKWLEHIFISPLQHQIHHSIYKHEHHKNMGSHLAIWDWIFGTLKTSESINDTISFGLPDDGNVNYNSFLDVLWGPVKRSLGIKRIKKNK